MRCEKNLKSLVIPKNKSEISVKRSGMLTQ